MGFYLGNQYINDQYLRNSLTNNTTDVETSALLTSDDTSDLAIRTKLNFTIETKSEEELVNSFLDLLTKYNISDYSSVVTFSRAHVLAILYLVDRGISEANFRNIIFSTSYESRTDILLSLLDTIETPEDIDIFAPLLGAVRKISNVKNSNEYASLFASKIEKWNNNIFFGKEVYNNVRLNEAAVSLARNDDSDYDASILFKYCYKWESSDSEVLKKLIKELASSCYSLSGRLSGALGNNSENSSIYNGKDNEINASYWISSSPKYKEIYKKTLTRTQYRKDNGYAIRAVASLKNNEDISNLFQKSFFSLPSEDINDDILSNVLYKIANYEFTSRDYTGDNKVDSDNLLSWLDDSASAAYASYFNYALKTSNTADSTKIKSKATISDSQNIFNIYSKLSDTIVYNSSDNDEDTKTISHDICFKYSKLEDEDAETKYEASKYYILQETTDVTYILNNYFNGNIIKSKDEKQYSAATSYSRYVLDTSESYDSSKTYYTASADFSVEPIFAASATSYSTSLSSFITGSTSDTNLAGLINLIKPYIDSTSSDVYLDNNFFMKNILSSYSMKYSKATMNYIGQYIINSGGLSIANINYVLNFLSANPISLRYSDQTNKELTKSICKFDILMTDAGYIKNFGTCPVLETIEKIIAYLKTQIAVPTSSTDIINYFSGEESKTGLSDKLKDITYSNISSDSDAYSQMVFYIAKTIIENYLNYLNDRSSTTSISTILKLDSSKDTSYYKFYKILFFIRHMILAYSQYGSLISSQTIYKKAVGNSDPTSENADINIIKSRLSSVISYDKYFGDYSIFTDNGSLRRSSLQKIYNSLDSWNVVSTDITPAIKKKIGG